MKELIQLKQSDLQKIRDLWYTENSGICPILKIPVEKSNIVIDHQHKLKSELPDDTGKGCCRGAIEFRCNALEGKITNAFKRYGLEKQIDLPTFLRNLADYLDNNKIHEDVLYIHPSEKPKSKKLRKSSYNKLKKLEKKLPEYTGNYTKNIEKLFNKHKITPEFY